MQKALRMVDPFAVKGFEGAKGVEKLNADQILDELIKPTDKRIFLIHRVLKEGIYSVLIQPTSHPFPWLLDTLRGAVRCGVAVLCDGVLL